MGWIAQEIAQCTEILVQRWVGFAKLGNTDCYENWRPVIPNPSKAQSATETRGNPGAFEPNLENSGTLNQALGIEHARGLLVCCI
jgi:hypothetical protein